MESTSVCRTYFDWGVHTTISQAPVAAELGSALGEGRLVLILEGRENTISSNTFGI
jgi:hypothetical protein